MIWSLLLLPMALSKDCPMYGCHKGGEDWGEECLKQVGDDYLMQICDPTANPYCHVDWSSSVGTCNSSPEPHNHEFFPGDPCSANSQCVTEQCVDGTCVGKQVGEPCVSTEECGVGTYCSTSSMCEHQLELGKECESDWDCQNQLSCNRTIFASGQCVPYFSIKHNQPVGMCVASGPESQSLLCEQGTCDLRDPNENGPGVCIEPYMSITGFPSFCDEDSDCLGSNGNQSLEGDCLCGMDRDGYAYCATWSGDRPAVQSRDLLKKHFQSTNITKCHTMTRTLGTCVKRTLSESEFRTYQEETLLLHDVARYSDNDFCTQVILNDNYYHIPFYDIECQAFSCAKADEMSAGTCATFTQGRNAFQILPCSDSSEYCDAASVLTDPWKNVTCSKSPPPSEKYAGDKCGTSAECLSQDCSSGTCVGVKLGGDCKLNEDCDLGLYCEIVNNTCGPLETEHASSTCIIDYDCDLNLGCNLTDSAPGTCVPYFSVATGDDVSCWATGVNLLCSTGFCNNTHSHMGTCVSPPASIARAPQQCHFNSDCAGNNPDLDSFTECACGLNPFGIRYCLPQLGDPQGQAYLSAMKAVLTHPKLSSVCQTTRRFNDDCWENLARADSLFNADEAYVAVYNLTHYADYINNKDCVKNTITAEFWSKASRL